MFGRILNISNNGAKVEMGAGNNNYLNVDPNVEIGTGVTTDVMNMHVIFENGDIKVLGEVDNIDGQIVTIRFLGEIINNVLYGGVIHKPTLDSIVRIISDSEVPLIIGEHNENNLLIGNSPYYHSSPIFINVNEFFSNHFAIFGNSGSGKTCGISRIIQNLFGSEEIFPFRSNIFLFDASGEYYNAFSSLNRINPNYNYRFITTSETDAGQGEQLAIPPYLLNSEDLTLLLECSNHSQLAIIQKTLDLARCFAQNDDKSNGYKDYIIAKAVMTILYSNSTSASKRDEIFSILESCSTDNFNLEAIIPGIGYTRKFRECFLIDNNGQLSEIILLTEYVQNFLKKEYENYKPPKNGFYTLDDLEKALNFTLISDGWLRNENTYSDATTLRVRLHDLLTGPNAKFFDYKENVDIKTFISSLLVKGNQKYQIVNINFNDVDDSFAKAITKIFSRMLFEFTKVIKDRGSIPIHIFIEEAHRYIQQDKDHYIIGYNIFDRIAKEGRKYALILGIITQRPVEMSDTVLSQCSNFLIFKMTHPMDVDYIKKMLPNITDEIVEKQKSLQSGTCLGFGTAFKVPLIIKMDMPNPAPQSENCDVKNKWHA
ncbi:MAG: ATP-binding protein [Bacilli bacterium]